jgi:hypothetical protein
MIIFVSYSSKNHDLARALAVQVGVYGHDVQFEQKMIGGRVGWHEVFESIRLCDLFLLVVTERSIDSYSCQLEYGYANSLGKRILPVVIEDLEDAIVRQHFGNAYVRWQPDPAHQAGLEQALQQIAEQPPLPKPAIPPLRPDWLNPMITLRDSVIALPQGPRAQFSILDNLSEFLEREDSLPDTLAIIRVLQTNPQLAQPVALELAQTLYQLNKNRARQNAPHRVRRLLRDIGLIVAGALLILIIARAIQFFNRPEAAATTPTPAVTDEAVSLAALLEDEATTEVVGVATLKPATPTRDLTAEQISLEIRGTVTAAISTAIAVASYTVTPIPSDTPTPLPEATDAPTNTPDLEGTLMGLNLQGTSTAAVGTALAVASFVPPPAATAAPTNTQDVPGTRTMRNLQATATSAVGTAIAVASYTLTPIPSNTATPPPQATIAPTNTPDLEGTLMGLSLQETSTAAVGTALAVAAFTATPPLALTPIASATFASSTNNAVVTPVPTLSFQQQLTAIATSSALVYVGMQVEDTDQGVRVTAVGNSARQAGVRVGDYVTAVDVETFNDRAGFLSIMSRHRAFTQVTFRLTRGNSTIYIRVPLALLDFGSPSAAASAS